MKRFFWWQSFFPQSWIGWFPKYLFAQITTMRHSMFLFTYLNESIPTPNSGHPSKQQNHKIVQVAATQAHHPHAPSVGRSRKKEGSTAGRG